MTTAAVDELGLYRLLEFAPRIPDMFVELIEFFRDDPDALDRVRVFARDTGAPLGEAIEEVDSRDPIEEAFAAYWRARDDSEQQAALAALRTLQEQEVVRMRDFARTRRQLDPGEARAARAKADALLREYEDPSSRHDPS